MTFRAAPISDDCVAIHSRVTRFRA